MQQSPAYQQRRNASHGITAVILDYGQVLTQSPTAEEFGRLAEVFNVSFERFYELWEASRGPYDRGDFSPEQYWLKLATEASTSIDRSQIEMLRKVEVEIWARPDPRMLDWVSQLQAAGIKTALLSNMPSDLVTHLRKNCQWIEKFAFKTFSAEVRLIKPNPAIYEHALSGLGVPATEALFVDDREDNILAARALGIRGIQFRSMAQLKNDLERLSFPILPADGGSSSAVSRAASPADRSVQDSTFSPLL